MIIVSALVRRGAPWASGISCQLISDTSLEELQAFAELLGLRPLYYERAPVPYFALGPYSRNRAIQLGARAARGAEFFDAQLRYRAANRLTAREERRIYREWLAAGPARGPYPGRKQ